MTTLAQKTTITVQAGDEGKAISTDLIGIFFEDISYAADGGLYGELVQNRSFEYQITEQRTWSSLSFWELLTRDGGKGSMNIDRAVPIHPNNPHYLVLEVANSGGGVGLSNPGFDGIPIQDGETYDFSIFARQLYMDGRWGGEASTIEGRPMPISVRLESTAGNLLGELNFEIAGREWKRLEGEITAKGSDSEARLVILAKASGGIALDEISLFPRKTFRSRKNGLRSDLAQVIADLKPKFVRFPGGCVAHGNGLGNMYRWKDTIGPVEQRKGQANLWGYHQSNGLGYFEYFQFCEDIGAQPLPVVPAGVCCQNSGYTGGMGQQGLPMDQMEAYVQEVLDLVEWANGPATSPWGSKRAAAGHPEPFHLKYLGVGNEDKITPVFEKRFRMIYEAVKAKYPEIVVVGTVGPSHAGEDYDAGWKIARELEVPMVDEHYYESPGWFWNNQNRYDSYDRSKSKVYVGEYAVFDEKRGSTLRAAIAEAAYLTSLERNGDIVHFASYAPLLAKRNYARWNPNLIFFTNTEIVPTISYFVQQLFSVNNGDRYLTSTVDGPLKTTEFAHSAVRDSKNGGLILKLVNGSNTVQPLHIKLANAKNFRDIAETFTLAASDPGVANDYDNPKATLPQPSTAKIAQEFDYEVPANSLTVIRIQELL